MKPNEQFFVGQKAFVEKDNKLLILIDPRHGLDVPGGRIQEGEADLPASFRREIKEEIQIDIDIGSPFYTWIWKKHESLKTFLVGYMCAYVAGEIKLSEEHSEYYWVTKENYKSVLSKYWDESNPLCQTISHYFNLH